MTAMAKVFGHDAGNDRNNAPTPNGEGLGATLGEGDGQALLNLSLGIDQMREALSQDGNSLADAALTEKLVTILLGIQPREEWAIDLKMAQWQPAGDVGGEIAELERYDPYGGQLEADSGRNREEDLCPLAPANINNSILAQDNSFGIEGRTSLANALLLNTEVFCTLLRAMPDNEAARPYLIPHSAVKTCKNRPPKVSYNQTVKSFCGLSKGHLEVRVL
jgi:hypothetical protein